MREFYPDRIIVDNVAAGVIGQIIIGSVRFRADFVANVLKVGLDRFCIELLSIRIGDVLAQMIGIFRGVSIDFPAFRRPWLDRAGHGILIGQRDREVARYVERREIRNLDRVHADRSLIDSDLEGAAENRGTRGLCEYSRSERQQSAS